MGRIGLKGSGLKRRERSPKPRHIGPPKTSPCKGGLAAAAGSQSLTKGFGGVASMKAAGHGIIAGGAPQGALIPLDFHQNNQSVGMTLFPRIQQGGDGVVFPVANIPKGDGPDPCRRQGGGVARAEFFQFLFGVPQVVL